MVTKVMTTFSMQILIPAQHRVAMQSIAWTEAYKGRGLGVRIGMKTCGPFSWHWGYFSQSMRYHILSLSKSNPSIRVHLTILSCSFVLSDSSSCSEFSSNKYTMLRQLFQCQTFICVCGRMQSGSCTCIKDTAESINICFLAENVFFDIALHIKLTTTS